jgi:enamine deaminase RidA (YjgF/YER057c/UK114 family)
MYDGKKETQTLNMPWEAEYGYAQAVKKGETVWVSGQLGHDEKGILAAGIEAQMSQAYRNIKKLLEAYKMAMDDVVEEVLYVTDMAAAFEVRKKIGPQSYADPKRVASTIVEISRLAIPGQLVEIKVIAVETI